MEARRNSTGSSRASSLRVENRSSADHIRRNSATNDIVTDFRHTCKLCSRLINAGMMVRAAGYSWHADCFVCRYCHQKLTDYHKHNDQLVCESCMSTLTGKCAVCKKYLGNSYVISNDCKYHSACFRCSQCSLPLGSKENYSLCDEGRIICDNCYQNNVISLISGERAVEIEWSKLTTETQPDGSVMVSSTEDCALIREGDIVLTINGSRPTQEIMRQLNPQSRVKLTVHSLATRNRSSSSNGPNSFSPPLPPSPPPPSTRSHKRRLLKSLSTSPPPLETSPGNGRPSYIYTPCQVEVGQVIGSGFFGRVCEARLVATGEQICMKELQHVDREAAKAFIDEVALLKNLKHVNVLAFKGIVSNPPTFSLLTEYVPGGTLRNLIKSKEKPIPWSHRLSIALNVSSGMSYLHSKEIIHRDLTSKNCLLREDGTAVVADFGLAQYQQASHYLSISYLCPPVVPGKRRNTPVGAVYWRAPEMLLDKPYDSKVDVFSFGIVMCELIARVKADPDYLPRNSADWGLDEPGFREIVPRDCPGPFLDVVVQCCCTTPELRPSFTKLCEFLHLFTLDADQEEYRDSLHSITRTLHMIVE